MYNPEEDVVPYELLEKALMISKVKPPYKLYFDRNTGDILSISNEEIEDFSTSIEIDYSLVKEFFDHKKNIINYKVIFTDETTPNIVNKKVDDVDLINIEEVSLVDHWDSLFTVENYVLLKKWGFQLRPDQRKILKNHNLSTTFEVFIVDQNYSYQLIRTIKIPLYEVLNNDKFFVDYESEVESNEMNRIFVKKFFKTIGYRVLYDTES